MARKKNAAEIKEPDEYHGLVRLAMLDFRGRHQRKLFCQADSQVRPPGYVLLAK